LFASSSEKEEEEGEEEEQEGKPDSAPANKRIHATRAGDSQKNTKIGAE